MAVLTFVSVGTDINDSVWSSEQVKPGLNTR